MSLPPEVETQILEYHVPVPRVAPRKSTWLVERWETQHSGWKPINGVCCDTKAQAIDWLRIAQTDDPDSYFRIALWIREHPL